MVHHLAAKLAPSTVDVAFGRVVTVFRAAVRDRVVTASPCVGIRLPPEKPASLLTVFTTADIHAMAGAVHERYAALIMFGAATGLRPGELFGLTKVRVRFLSRRVVVDQPLVRLADGIGIGPLKTRSSYRTVPRPQVAADLLTAHLRHYFASALIRSGASVKVVQARLGTRRRRPRSTSTAICSPTRRTERGPRWT